MATDAPADPSEATQYIEVKAESVTGNEHRSVTVLMIDIVGSTDLMERLGHENYGAVLQRFHSICTAIVRSNNGFVAEYHGDGMLCYFGYHRASEDDAVHAVRTALLVVTDLEKSRSETVELKARFGLSSGLVLTNDQADQFGASAVGTCIHRAARLEALAEPNTVFICDDTRRLIGRTFQLKERGIHQFEGIARPEPVFQVVRTRSGLTTRFDTLRGHLAGDFVGRQAEFEKLRSLYDTVDKKGGCAVTVTADAGLGKSRLIQNFLQSPEIEGAPSFVLQCSPEHIGTTLYPVVRYLEWVAGATNVDVAQTRMDKLQRLFKEVWGLSADDSDILLDLMNPFEAKVSLDRADSVVVRRNRALNILADQIFTFVDGRGKFVVVFEDVHWLDPTSAQLLDILLERVNAYPVLIVLSTRKEPPYGDGLVTAPPLQLSSMSNADAHALAQQILGEDAPTERLVEMSEGVPLILQEYAEILKGTGDVGLKTSHVPMSLTSIIQSKLDRLDGDGRAFVRAASALGRTFDPALVTRVTLGDGPHTARMLEALGVLNLTRRADDIQDHELVSFTHALIRDAVYRSMPRAERCAIHDAIANAYLGKSAPPTLGDHVLADHLAKAERGDEAAQHYVAAALTATKKGAAAEALGYLDAGLAAIEMLPKGEKRDHIELQLLAVKGPTLMVTRGPGNADFGLTQARALELVERLDMLEEMLPVVFYTAEHAWAVADLDRADTMADAILKLDEQSPSDVAHLAGNLLKGMVAWHRGDNGLAAESFDRVLARYDMEAHKALYAHFIKEFGVFSQFYLGLVRTIQGDFVRGLALAEGAVSLSEKLKFPHERGFALLARFNTALLRDDVATADLASQEALAFSKAQGFPEFVAMAEFVQGWSRARRGEVAEGVALMQSGFGAWKDTGFTCWQALFAAILAPYLVRLGRLSEAADLVDTYVELIDTTGEEQYRAPLLLARGVIQREKGQHTSANENARAAYTVAQAQGAVVWKRWVQAEFRLLLEGEQ